jgi:hypothetical protein
MELPAEIGVLSGRELAWTMAGLIQRHRLNYLSLEALATATILDAPVVLSESAQSPLLIASCAEEGVRVVLVKL